MGGDPAFRIYPRWAFAPYATDLLALRPASGRIGDEIDDEQSRFRPSICPPIAILACALAAAVTTAMHSCQRGAGTRGTLFRPAGSGINFCRQPCLAEYPLRRVIDDWIQRRRGITQQEPPAGSTSAGHDDAVRPCTRQYCECCRRCRWACDADEMGRHEIGRAPRPSPEQRLHLGLREYCIEVAIRLTWLLLVKRTKNAESALR